MVMLTVRCNEPETGFTNLSMSHKDQERWETRSEVFNLLDVRAPSSHRGIVPDRLSVFSPASLPRCCCCCFFLAAALLERQGGTKDIVLCRASSASFPGFLLLRLLSPHLVCRYNCGAGISRIRAHADRLANETFASS